MGKNVCKSMFFLPKQDDKIYIDEHVDNKEIICESL